MYARLGKVRVKPGRLDDFLKTFVGDMMPPARSLNGFKGATVLADRGANEVTLISYWATEADARAVAPTGGSINSQIAKVSDLIEGPPIVSHVAVLHQE